MKKLSEKICLKCTNKFKPTGLNQKYCLVCSKINEKEKDKKYKKQWRMHNPYKSKGITHFQCLYCKKPTTKIGNAKKRFCSKSCMRIKNREIFFEKFGFTKKRNKIQKPLKKRFFILQRDRFTCQYCGVKAQDTPLHIDHIIPKSKGGTNSLNNLITSCINCNLGKKDILLNF